MARVQTCSCGGKLQPATLTKIDLKPLFGLLGVLEGPVPGLRCNKCGEETFDGAVFDRVLFAVARSVLGQTRILTGDEARFLRKAALGLTQALLAEQMGINPVTVADWERGERPLSKEHDYELRGIAFAALVARLGSRLVRDIDALVREILDRPRTAAPPRRAHRYVVSASLMPVA